MATAATMRAQLRAFLDDEQSIWRQGSMWSDTELDLALDAAQLAFVRYTYVKQQWHLISSLYSEVSGSSPVTLPPDYMFYSSATVDNGGAAYPAQLQIGWSSRNNQGDRGRYTATIGSASIEFSNGGVASSGKLSYYSRPTKISGASTHTQMNESCYDFIVYHAAAILQQKDYGQCRRALKSMEAILKSITEEPFRMYPAIVDNHTEV
jgi:hypothetical protein